MEEKKYQIFEFSAKFVCDGKHDERYPKWSEGLPEGRIRDSVSTTWMSKEEVTEEQAREKAESWWKDFSKKSDKHPSDQNITVTFARRETWCTSWFSHWTFDVGQTDDEAIDSFERYVTRMEIENEKNGHYNNQKSQCSDLSYVCLMGAEDRYRWRNSDEEHGKPCRCDGCKKFGVIRINH